MDQARAVSLRDTLPALADLNQILDYIAERSPSGARRAHARIQAITYLLPTHPHIGTRTDDPTIRRHGSVLPLASHCQAHMRGELRGAYTAGFVELERAAHSQQLDGAGRIRFIRSRL
jgi:plasmid stabilization system protein ParE